MVSGIDVMMAYARCPPALSLRDMFTKLHTRDPCSGVAFQDDTAPPTPSSC